MIASALTRHRIPCNLQRRILRVARCVRVLFELPCGRIGPKAGPCDCRVIGCLKDACYPAAKSRPESEALLKKVIVTGANGVGKSHFANRLAMARSEIPLISFDAIKLQTGWQQRPRSEIEAALSAELEKDAWILEGGPSLLAQAVDKADALVWLDPPELLRAWQLATRPWKNFGKTRPELPSGNVDWPLQQYRFALRSLKNRSKFHRYISEVFDGAEGLQKWRCRSASDRASVLKRWADAGV